MSQNKTELKHQGFFLRLRSEVKTRSKFPTSHSRERWMTGKVSTCQNLRVTKNHAPIGFNASELLSSKQNDRSGVLCRASWLENNQIFFAQSDAPVSGPFMLVSMLFKTLARQMLLSSSLFGTFERWDDWAQHNIQVHTPAIGVGYHPISEVRLPDSGNRYLSNWIQNRCKW